jgi:prepilin-type processing-associated H-X9-DG protein
MPGIGADPNPASETAANKAFAQSIGSNEDNLRDVKLGALDDPVAVPVVFDGGSRTSVFQIVASNYPDACQMLCYPGNQDPSCVDYYNEMCPFQEQLPLPLPTDFSWQTDASVRKQWARHLGGINIGFADGHAAWMDSERVNTAYAESKRGEPSAIDAAWCAYCGNSVDCAPNTTHGSGTPFIF